MSTGFSVQKIYGVIEQTSVRAMPLNF